MDMVHAVPKHGRWALRISEDLCGALEMFAGCDLAEGVKKSFAGLDARARR